MMTKTVLKIENAKRIAIPYAIRDGRSTPRINIQGGKFQVPAGLEEVSKKGSTTIRGMVDKDLEQNMKLYKNPLILRNTFRVKIVFDADGGYIFRIKVLEGLVEAVSGYRFPIHVAAGTEFQGLLNKSIIQHGIMFTERFLPRISTIVVSSRFRNE